MGIKYSEYIPRRRCTKERLLKLKEYDIKTTGYDRDMERIILSYGYGLPSLVNDEESVVQEQYGFRLKEYVRITLNYSDALAEELILLKELNLLGNGHGY